jgi:hypothetical protein
MFVGSHSPARQQRLSGCSGEAAHRGRRTWNCRGQSARRLGGAFVQSRRPAQLAGAEVGEAEEFSATSNLAPATLIVI